PQNITYIERQMDMNIQSLIWMVVNTFDMERKSPIKEIVPIPFTYMKIIEIVETTIDLDVLEKILKKHSFPKEYNSRRFKRWLKRLKTEGTLFLRTRKGMTLKDY